MALVCLSGGNGWLAWGVRLMGDEVTAIDTRKKVVKFGQRFADINYDRLIIAPGIDFMFDAIQGLGVLPFDLTDLGVDIVCGGTHKWLGGPLWHGFLAMQPQRASELAPLLHGAMTYGTTDAFLEHFGLANLVDLPGAAEMKAAGLLGLDLPAGFSVPDPAAAAPDEDPLEEGESPEFHRDYLEAEDGEATL